MTLIDNWKRTLTHGYATWCVYLTIAIQAAVEMLPYMGEAIPSWLPIGVLSAALVLRVVKQKTVSNPEADDE